MEMLQLGSYQFDVPALLAHARAMDPDGQEAIGFLEAVSGGEL